MLLAFEGIDGSGKSTQARMVASALRERTGADVLLVREPGGTPLGEELRNILLDTRWGDLAPETELFLFMAARSHLVRTCIRPALERGRLVVTDRFLWSSVVYQGIARGIPEDEVLRVGDLALGGVSVSRTFVLDLDPEEAFRRVRDPNRMEGRGVEFQRRVREGFLRLAGRFPEASVVIDASGAPEQVLRRIISHLPDGA